MSFISNPNINDEYSSLVPDVDMDKEDLEIFEEELKQEENKAGKIEIPAPKGGSFEKPDTKNLIQIPLNEIAANGNFKVNYENFEDERPRRESFAYYNSLNNLKFEGDEIPQDI